jgi:hypothetical protein
MLGDEPALLLRAPVPRLGGAIAEKADLRVDDLGSPFASTDC